MNDDPVIALIEAAAQLVRIAEKHWVVPGTMGAGAVESVRHAAKAASEQPQLAPCLTPYTKRFLAVSPLPQTSEGGTD